MRRFASAAALLLLALAAAAARAATGQIESFFPSTTTVTAGGTVEFTAWYTIQTSSGSYGGENPDEPAPAEGHQVWQTSWLIAESELLDSVTLEVAGHIFSGHPVVAPGGLHSETLAFSLPFLLPGTFTVELAGGWRSNVQQTSSIATATRDCFNVDPGGTNELACTPWETAVVEDSDDYLSVGSFEPRGVEITVLAVPEPSTLALGALGLAALAGAAGRLRVPPVARYRGRSPASARNTPSEHAAHIG